jgi:hypothetical protein
MTTVVNGPAPSGDNGTGFLIGALVLVFFGFLFVYYGLPAIKNMGPVKIQVDTPTIVVPNSVDVNVKPVQ